MRKLIGVMAIAMLLIVGLIAPATAQATDHCPDKDNPAKVEVDESFGPTLPADVIPEGTEFCVKAGTGASGKLISDGNDYTVTWLNNGEQTPGISYYIVYVPVDDTDYCDPSNQPSGVNLKTWLGEFDAAECFDIEPVLECGSFDAMVTGPYEGYEMVYVEGADKSTSLEWETLPASFVEDYSGGSVNITTYLVGPEGDYLTGTGLPNYWDNNGRTVTIDTDCKSTPKPDPKPDPEPEEEPEPEPVADIAVVHDAVCATEDTYDLDLTFANDGDADGMVTVNILESSTAVFVEAGDSITESFSGIPAGVLAEVFFDEDNITFVSDEGIDYDACTATLECIDINTASLEELQLIIHVGDEDRDQQIVTLRPFDSVEDLIRVNGIGDVRLSEILDEGLASVDCDPTEPEPEPEPEPKPEPKPEPTPVERDDAPVPTRVDAGSGGELPNTGLPAWLLSMMGLGLMLAGGGALRLGRSNR